MGTALDCSALDLLYNIIIIVIFLNIIIQKAQIIVLTCRLHAYSPKQKRVFTKINNLCCVWYRILIHLSTMLLLTATLKLSNCLFVLGQESHKNGGTKLVGKSQAHDHAAFMRRMQIIFLLTITKEKEV